MNLVEVWFRIVERQAIGRRVSTFVKDLNTKIRASIDGWNDRSHPFVWTQTAEEILTKANHPTTSIRDVRELKRYLARQIYRRLNAANDTPLTA